MKRIVNDMKLRLRAVSENEGVARACISAFVADANPTLEELCDIRCAVSEAVTNAIVHAYRDLPKGEVAFIYISARLYDNREVTVEVADTGCGIEDQLCHSLYNLRELKVNDVYDSIKTKLVKVDDLVDTVEELWRKTLV